VIVISDTSPITNLAAVGYLNLLQKLYSKIIIPQAVYRRFGYKTPSFSKAEDGFIFGTILVVNDPPETMESDSLTSEVQ
jgi:predicted nucleic acid-binding protein